jgi:hypothetical protein
MWGYCVCIGAMFANEKAILNREAHGAKKRQQENRIESMANFYGNEAGSCAAVFLQGS